MNNLHTQKVKPCGRTTRFSTTLHCQAQKGRWTVLYGGQFSVSRFLVCSEYTYCPEYCLLMRRHDMPTRHLLHLLRCLPLLPPHLHLRSSHHTKTKCAFYNLVDICLRDVIYPNYQRQKHEDL